MSNIFFPDISWIEQVTFDEMRMKSVLYLINTLRWIFIVLSRSNNKYFF